MLLKSRTEELKSITRYSQNTVCKPMFYTPNLWIHINRVTWLAEELSIQLWLSPEITKKVVRRAMFHDDSEIIAWDIATPVKQNWSQEEKEDYEKKCANAIPILVQSYGNELWNDYQAILKEMECWHQKLWEDFTLIHAIIEYVDKLDALMEVCHELYSWSSSFLKNLKDTYNFDINWFNYVLQRVLRRRNNLEKLLWKILPQKWVLNMKELEELNTESVVKNWNSHTEKLILESSWVEVYDIWKQLHINKGEIEQQKKLYIQNITY